VLSEAVALWRGPALTELDGWTGGRVESARLDELHRDAEELEVDAAIRAGRAREVLNRAHRLVGEAPLREGRWALLALAQYQSGQQVQALRTLRQVRTVLANELGLDPGPEVTALERAILRQDPSLVVDSTLSRRGSRALLRAREDVTPAEQGDLEQQMRFCRTNDGVTLAYASSGSGPPLVKAANWLTHLDHDWHSTVWRHWLVGLSRHHTLVRYDERGCGLSDWDIPEPELDEWVRDLEAVVDAAGLDRFPLLGISQGGAVAVHYAARHPERVTKLVLYGTYVQGRLVRATTDTDREVHDLQVELARLGWGRDDPAFRQVFTAQFMPQGSRELWDEFNELQRQTTSAENAARVLDLAGGIDVSDAARRVRAPTLVLHARDDQRPPFEQGRMMAALIPDSRFVALESRNHILLADEPAWPVFLHAVESFLAE
jgi:pimeloyl-ACP methyl ester carboxylesterase